MSRYEAAHLVAEHVRDCVCGTLEAVAVSTEGHPGCPCRVFVTAGEHVDACPDGGCEEGPTGVRREGQLSVSVARVFRSTSFPTEDGVGDLCEPTRYVAEIVVRLLRCWPQPGRSGMVTEERLEAAARKVNVDMLALQEAAMCCVPVMAGRSKDLRVAIASHVPTGPAGGCAGSEMRLLVELGDVCRCEEPVS